MSQLRPFTDADWDAFSGCNSPNPLIAYLTDEVVVLVDDTTVQVHTTAEDPADEEVWSFEFASHDAAVVVGNAIVDSGEGVEYAKKWLRRIS